MKLVICVGIGVVAANIIGDAIRPSLGYWATFAVSIIAGCVAAGLSGQVWQRVTR